jgi:hypothetical protein
MFRLIVLSIFAVLGVACGSGSLDLAFTPDERVKSLILATERDGELVMRAIDLEGNKGLVRFTLFDDADGQDARLTAFGYAVALAELDLQPGRMDSAVLGEPRRGLPPFLDRHEGRLEGAFSGWSESNNVADLDRFALRETTIAECLERGGCFPTRDRRSCQLPCPEPPILVEPNVPASPTPPELPNLAPCQPGFAETTLESGATVCEPHTAPIPECSGEQYYLYGSTGCERLGTSCPSTADPWAIDLPANELILYAGPGATGEPDGTKEQPFTTLRDALLAADIPGTIVAAATGVWDEDVAIPEGVILWGACPRETRLRFTGNPEPSTITVYGNNAGIRNLTIEGPRSGIAVLGSVRIEDVVIESPSIGIIADASQVDADRLVIRDAVDHGVYANLGGSVTLERTLIEDARGFGLTVNGAGTSMIIERSAVRGSSDAPAERLQVGVIAGEGASLQLRSSVIEDRVGIGVIVEKTATRATISDVVIRGMRRTPIDRSHGHATLFNQGSIVELERVWVDRTESVSMIWAQPETTVTASVVVINGSAGMVIEDSTTATITKSLIDDSSGTALFVLNSSHVRVEDCTILNVGNSSSAIRIDDKSVFNASRVRVENAAGSSIDVIDSIFHGSDLSFVGRDEPSPGAGRGLNIERNAQVVVDRLAIESARYGAVVSHDDSNVTIRDLWATDAREDGLERTSGFGMFIASGSQVHVTRAWIVRSAYAGISAHDVDTRLTIDDLLIDETNPADNASGGALESIFGATVIINRAQLRSNRRAGIVASGALATFDGTNVRVIGTAPIAGCELCDADALRLEVGASIVLRRFELLNNQGAAIAMIENQAVMLEDGAVENNEIAVRSTSAEIAIESLATRVRYRNNGASFSLY